jgi:hypothetical protein
MEKRNWELLKTKLIIDIKTKFIYGEHYIV